MGDDDEPTAKVLFRVERGDGSIDVETLWAFVLGDDLYRLDNSPFDAYSVSWRDVVLAPIDVVEGRAVFQRVVAKSGHRTVRIRFGLPWARGNGTEAVLQGLLGMGCTYEGADDKLFSVDVPPPVSLQAVREYLIRSEVEWEHADPTYDELFPGK